MKKVAEKYCVTRYVQSSLYHSIVNMVIIFPSNFPS